MSGKATENHVFRIVIPFVPITRFLCSALQQSVKLHLYPSDGIVWKPAAACVRSSTEWNDTVRLHRLRQKTLSFNRPRIKKN